MRDWYLDKLGVVQYESRAPGSLPSAAENPANDRHSPEPEQSSPEPEQSSREPGQNSLDSIGNQELSPAQSPEQISVAEPAAKAVIDDIASELEEAAAEIRHQELESAPAQESKPLTFRLACWQPTQDLLVIDSLEPGGNVSREQAQLLTNMVNALLRLQSVSDSASEGMAVELAALLQFETIDWPQSADTSRAAAVAMLAAFLEARITARGVCRVLLMGELVAELIGGSDAGEGLRQLPGGASACVVPSLAELLEDSSKKALAWRAMQKLV